MRRGDHQGGESNNWLKSQNLNFNLTSVCTDYEANTWLLVAVVEAEMQQETSLISQTIEKRRSSLLLNTFYDAPTSVTLL